MSTRPINEVTATRDGKWWGLTVKGRWNIISQVQKLSDAERMIREAIAMGEGVDQDSLM